ncbi:MAG: hypothetical protein ACI8RZ_000680 [Myxococcota bacterium]|jgi:hypothetical protein
MPPPEPSQPPDAPSQRRVLLLLNLAGLLGLLVLLWRRVAPGEGVWFFSDDFTYIRWVLQHQNHPLDALSAAIFQHIRPATLWTWMASLQVSDGDWWGPYGALQLGVIATVLGAGAFAWALTEEVRCGWLATVLMTGEVTADALLGWSSWMNVALETAMTLWGLALGTLAIRHRRVGWLLGAVVLLGLAGMFKEPGWLVGPITLLAVVLHTGADRRRWGMAAVPLVVAVVGFGLTFHAENVERYQRNLSDPLAHFTETIAQYGDSVASLWPLQAADPGVPVLFLAIALAGVAAPSWRMVLGLSVVLGTGLYALPGLQAGMVSVLCVGALLWRRSPPLLAAAVHAAILLPAPMLGSPGHSWGMVTMLTVWVAVGCEQAVGGLPGRRGWLVWGLLLGLAAARLPAALDRAEPEFRQRADEDRALIEAAVMLAHAVDAEAWCALRPQSGVLMTMLPIGGVVLPSRWQDVSHAIALDDEVVLLSNQPPQLTHPLELTERRSQRLELEAGRYVLIVDALDVEAPWPVRLSTRCQPARLPATTPALPGGGWAAATITIEEGCTSIRLQTERSTDRNVRGGVMPITPISTAMPRQPQEGERARCFPKKR